MKVKLFIDLDDNIVGSRELVAENIQVLVSMFDPLEKMEIDTVDVKDTMTFDEAIIQINEILDSDVIIFVPKSDGALSEICASLCSLTNKAGKNGYVYIPNLPKEENDSPKTGFPKLAT